MGSVASYLGLDPAERAELEWLLESGALGRSANLVKVLRYLCEESAAGRAEQIKEYAIAVEALGRKPDFDPQIDTIVRVTVHSLRKRLQEIYINGEGASHRVRVVIPSGGYGAQFLRNPEVVLPVPDKPAAEATFVSQTENGAAATPPIGSGESSEATGTHGSPWRWWIVAFVAIAVAATIWLTVRSQTIRKGAQVQTPIPAVTVTGPTRILLGENRRAYTDHSGDVWTPQPSCQGGENIPSTGATVTGTEDSYLYDGGLRGFVRCTFHASPGFYELHLHFAEPTNLEPAERVVNILVNAGLNQSLDVVDRAGSDHAATTFTIPGIMPENDGTIHLDFTSEVSPLNAIEIIPAPSAQPLPLRIIAAPSAYKDDRGVVWQSDRYYRGGRHSHPPVREHGPDLGLYASGRIGNFEYTLPAPVGSKYKVTLYFHEAWLGQSNGTPGGVGSRVFDVYCNGQGVLHNFDILAEGNGQNVVKTIEHVTPTALGMINLHFEQVANYPLVNAIEIVPEQP